MLREGRSQGRLRNTTLNKTGDVVLQRVSDGGAQNRRRVRPVVVKGIRGILAVESGRDAEHVRVCFVVEGPIQVIRVTLEGDVSDDESSAADVVPVPVCPVEDGRVEVVLEVIDHARVDI